VLAYFSGARNVMAADTVNTRMKTVTKARQNVTARECEGVVILYGQFDRKPEPYVHFIPGVCPSSKTPGAAGMIAGSPGRGTRHG
jgi:hypothetical protein